MLPDRPLIVESLVIDLQSIWGNYAHMIFHFIELLLYITPFSMLIDTVPLEHPGICTTIHAACSITIYINAHLRHNPTFEHMPILIGRVIMLSGITLIAYCHRDASLKGHVLQHILALEAISQNHSNIFFGYAEELKMMDFSPVSAIEYLKSVIL
jgi:hypothetical protein